MILNLKSQTDFSGFCVVYKGSTYLEPKGLRGMSHLMEHLVCQNFKHLYSDFEREGIDWNAYTSSEEIVFYINGLNDNVNKFKNQIVDNILDGFKPTEEEFEKERQVVYEEYLDLFNDQCYSHHLNLFRYMYNHYGPIGCKYDILSFTYKDCVNFYNDHFTKPTKIINVSAHDDFSRDIEFGQSEGVVTYTRGEYPEYNHENITRDTKVSIIDVSPVITEDLPEVKFLCKMLGKGIDSPLMDEVRTKRGLTYGVSCNASGLHNTASISITGTTSKDKVDEFRDTVTNIFNSKDKYMTKERFNIIMESCKIAKVKREILRYNNYGEYIENKDDNLFWNLDRINYDKLMDVYDDHFNIDTFNRTLDTDEYLNVKDDNGSQEVTKI